MNIRQQSFQKDDVHKNIKYLPWKLFYIEAYIFLLKLKYILFLGCTTSSTNAKNLNDN